MKLILLSGATKRPGWKTLDANPVHQADFVRHLPPLISRNIPEGSCEDIELIHGIGHFYKWDAQRLLREIHSALVPGGKLVLEQPNLLYAAAALLGYQKRIPGTADGQCDMWPLYGDPSHCDPLHGIKWGWTPGTLTDALVEAGFFRERISVHSARYHLPERDFRIEAIK